MQNLVNKIPSNSQEYFCPKYKDEVEQFLSMKERLWIGNLNKLSFEDIVIKKGQALRLFELKTDKRFSIIYETETVDNNQQNIIINNVDKGEDFQSGMILLMLADTL